MSHFQMARSDLPQRFYGIYLNLILTVAGIKAGYKTHNQSYEYMIPVWFHSHICISFIHFIHEFAMPGLLVLEFIPTYLSGACSCLSGFGSYLFFDIIDDIIMDVLSA